MHLERVLSDFAVRQSVLGALQRLAWLAGTAPNLDALLETGGKEVLHAFEADGLGVYLLEGDGPPRSLYAAGVTPDQVTIHQSVPRHATLAARVESDGIARSWLIEDYPEPGREVMVKSAFKAVAAAPLQVRSRIIGTLNVSYKRPTRLDAAQLQVLTAMAAHFASAIEAQRLVAQTRLISEANAHLYEELRTSSAELTRLNAQLVTREHLATLGEMTAVLAHEIRSPLGVLSNIVALFRQRVTRPAEEQALVDTMRQELSRMGHLVDVLLDFARPPAASLQQEHLEPLLQEVAQATRAHAITQQVEIVVVSAELPTLKMDTRLMRQALLNLTVNGVQSMRRPGRLWIRAHAEGASVLVDIEDEGDGMTPEVKARIFEPYFTTRSTGVGLGLILVKRIIDQHGGRIEVDSEPGRGTRVRIVLPAS